MLYVIDTGAIGRAQSSTAQSFANSSCGDHASVAWSAAMTAARNGTPTGGSIASIMTQMPAAARGTNDQVHVNGDHNGLNYYIDGVQLPASLNRVAGGEVDPNDIGYLDVIEGAYPAMYGGRFAAVLNIGTRAYSGPPGYTFDANGGSYGSYGSSLSLHAPVGTRGGSYSFSASTSGTDWSLDPAVKDPVHNAGSASNQWESNPIATA